MLVIIRFSHLCYQWVSLQLSFASVLVNCQILTDTSADLRKKTQVRTENNNNKSPRVPIEKKINARTVGKLSEKMDPQ